MERGRTKYTPNSGIPELRETISEYLHTSFKVKYEPSNEVLVTVGSSEAIDLALRALVSPGDEILIPEPCYIPYSPITSISGGKPVSRALDVMTIRVLHLTLQYVSLLQNASGERWTFSSENFDEDQLLREEVLNDTHKSHRYYYFTCNIPERAIKQIGG